MLKGEKAVMIRAFRKWADSDKMLLTDCYRKPSVAKQNAYYYCVRKMLEHNGRDIRIFSHNGFNFSVGFIGMYEGREAFFYITHSYDRVFPFVNTPDEYM